MELIDWAVCIGLGFASSMMAGGLAWAWGKVVRLASAMVSPGFD